MTYAIFLAVFLVPPLLAIIALQPGRLTMQGVAPLALLLLIVYAATIPWDSAAVARGLWSFDPLRTWSPRVALLPIEELCFFGLQTLLTGLWVRRRLLNGFSAEALR